MNGTGFECKELGYCYQNADGSPVVLWDRINVHFESGRASLLYGPTGSGKTTLLHVMAGLLRPTEGEVYADDRPFSRWNSVHRDQWRKQVGMVFQSPHLLASLTVLENVMLPMVPRSANLSEIRRKSLGCLEVVGMIASAGRSVRRLSAGESQRVSVARALVMEPRYLLADEPTSHQDDQGVERIMHALCSACDWGSTVVIASHDPRAALREWIGQCFELAGRRLVESQSCGILS